MWFPRPLSVDDVRIVGAGGILGREGVYRLLSDPTPVEWRDRVGVVGPVDGSAKSTSRLMACSGWVLKTNVDLAVSEQPAAIEKLRAAVELGTRVNLWHPDKVWVVYRAADLWYPASATPQLVTLRAVPGSAQRMAAWTRMVERAVEVALTRGIGLDLNPSNFGSLPADERLYYIDDEWYPKWTFLEFASGIVPRIPEEAGATDVDWESWGYVLGRAMEPLCAGRTERDGLVAAIESHPIAEKFRSRRDALCGGIRRFLGRGSQSKAGVALAKGRYQGRRRTAVLADVHANLAALEAVLQACANLDVDAYVFVGDAVGYGPHPRQCIQRLAELPNATFVRGNHDHAIGTGVLKEGMNHLARSCAGWTLGELSQPEREWLVSMPVEAGGTDWLAVHGAPKDPRRFLAYVYELTFQDNLEHLQSNGTRLCFCGHTHVQFIHAKVQTGDCQKLGAPSRTTLAEDSILLVNPGSVGQPRDRDPRAAFAIWDHVDGTISFHRVAYSITSVVEDMRRLGFPDGLGERLVQGT